MLLSLARWSNSPHLSEGDRCRLRDAVSSCSRLSQSVVLGGLGPADVSSIPLPSAEDAIAMAVAGLQLSAVVRPETASLIAAMSGCVQLPDRSSEYGSLLVFHDGSTLRDCPIELVLEGLERVLDAELTDESWSAVAGFSQALIHVAASWALTAAKFTSQVASFPPQQWVPPFFLRRHGSVELGTLVDVCGDLAARSAAVMARLSASRPRDGFESHMGDMELVPSAQLVRADALDPAWAGWPSAADDSPQIDGSVVLGRATARMVNSLLERMRGAPVVEETEAGILWVDMSLPPWSNVLESLEALEQLYQARKTRDVGLKKFSTEWLPEEHEAIRGLATALEQLVGQAPPAELPAEEGEEAVLEALPRAFATSESSDRVAESVLRLFRTSRPAGRPPTSRRQRASRPREVARLSTAMVDRSGVEKAVAQSKSFVLAPPKSLRQRLAQPSARGVRRMSTFASQETESVVSMSPRDASRLVRLLAVGPFAQLGGPARQALLSAATALTPLTSALQQAAGGEFFDAPATDDREAVAQRATAVTLAYQVASLDAWAAAADAFLHGLQRDAGPSDDAEWEESKQAIAAFTEFLCSYGCLELTGLLPGAVVAADRDTFRSAVRHGLVAQSERMHLPGIPPVPESAVPFVSRERGGRVPAAWLSTPFHKLPLGLLTLARSKSNGEYAALERAIERAQISQLVAFVEGPTGGKALAEATHVAVRMALGSAPGVISLEDARDLLLAVGNEAARLVAEATDEAVTDGLGECVDGVRNAQASLLEGGLTSTQAESAIAIVQLLRVFASEVGKRWGVLPAAVLPPALNSLSGAVSLCRELVLANPTRSVGRSRGRGKRQTSPASQKRVAEAASMAFAESLNSLSSVAEALAGKASRTSTGLADSSASIDRGDQNLLRGPDGSSVAPQVLLALSHAWERILESATRCREAERFEGQPVMDTLVRSKKNLEAAIAVTERHVLDVVSREDVDNGVLLDALDAVAAQWTRGAFGLNGALLVRSLGRRIRERRDLDSCRLKLALAALERARRAHSSPLDSAVEGEVRELMSGVASRLTLQSKRS
jgi:hypothetical protein